MKRVEIALTQGLYAIVFERDYKSLSQFNWYAQKSHDGHTFYAMRSVKNPRPPPRQKAIIMHRVILNAPEGVQVDHIDHNGLNNCRDNIRLATSWQNKGNTKLTRANTSGYIGVTWHKRDRRWQAMIKINGKSEYLGGFDDIIEAAEAHDEAALEELGEFAVLNFPTSR